MDFKDVATTTIALTTSILALVSVWSASTSFSPTYRHAPKSPPPPHQSLSERRPTHISSLSHDSIEHELARTDHKLRRLLNRKAKLELRKNQLCVNELALPNAPVVSDHTIQPTSQLLGSASTDNSIQIQPTFQALDCESSQHDRYSSDPGNELLLHDPPLHDASPSLDYSSDDSSSFSAATSDSMSYFASELDDSQFSAFSLGSDFSNLSASRYGNNVGVQ